MAERVVSVRLQAVTDQYKRAMAEAGKATESVAKADQLKKLGQRVSDLGDSMTTRLTLPIIGVAAAATKMSLGVDSVFTQMQTLAGVSAAEVEGLKESVMGLAGETGKAPQELAEALYFIRSSGFAGKEALDALEMSAKAAAAGLGSTIQVADAVTSAINGYGKEALTAARATDVLVATAQEGKAEASELAPQFGRLIPVAAELGISFDQIGAGLAFLSRNSGDAALSATQLNGVMVKLQEPGMEGAAALAAVGSSAEALRRSVREKGMLPALIELREQLEKNGMSFSDFSIDQQFTQGALQLTGAAVEEAEGIFQRMEEQTGQTDEAFSKWSESMGGKNAQAWAKFQVALIQFGDVLAPLVTDLLGFASELLKAFQGLPGPAQKLALALVALTAAAGPLLSIGGRIFSTWSAINKAFVGGIGGANAFGAAMNQGTAATSGFSGGLAATAIGLGVVAPLVIGAGIALDDYAQTKQKAAKATDDLVEALSREAQGMRGVVAETLNSKILEGDLGNMLKDSAADLDVFNKAVREQGDYVEDLDDKLGMYMSHHKAMKSDLREAAEAGNDFAEELLRLAESSEFGEAHVIDLINRLDALSDQYDDATTQAEKNKFAEEELVEQHGQVTDAFDEEAVAIEKAVEAIKGYGEAVKAQTDPLFGLLDAIRGNQEAARGVAEAQEALNTAIKDHGRDSEEAAEAQRALEIAYSDVGKSAVDVTVATSELNAAIKQNPTLLGQSKELLRQWQSQGLLTAEQAEVIGRQFDITAEKARNLGQTDPTISVFTNTLAAREGIADVNRRVDALDQRSATIDVYVRSNDELLAGYGVTVRATGPSRARALGGPVWAGEGYIVGEKGPEWFEPNVSGRIIPNHMLGALTPQSSYGGSGGWGGTIYIAVDMRGAIISSKADAARWVADAWNRAASRNMVTVRGRPL